MIRNGDERDHRHHDAAGTTTCHCPACMLANLQNQVFVLDANGVNAGFTNTVTPTAFDSEVACLDGVNSNGTLASRSFWTDNGQTPHKWGGSTAGSAGGSFAFGPASNFTATEQQTFLEALGLWSAVANVGFTQTSSTSDADIVLTRGSDGGANTSVSNSTARSPSRIGTIQPTVTISIDTSVAGFDLSGSFST